MIYDIYIGLSMPMKTGASFFIISALLLHFTRNWCLKDTPNVAPGKKIFVVDYSPDGSKIAYGGTSDNTAVVLDALNYSVLYTVAYPSGTQAANALKFSPNNLMLAVGFKNGNASLLNFETGIQYNFAATGLTNISAIDFTTNSSNIAFCGNIAALYDSKNGTAAPTPISITYNPGSGASGAGPIYVC
jgi:WD40 repeat protein